MRVSVDGLPTQCLNFAKPRYDANERLDKQQGVILHPADAFGAMCDHALGQPTPTKGEWSGAAVDLAAFINRNSGSLPAAEIDRLISIGSLICRHTEDRDLE